MSDDSVYAIISGTGVEEITIRSNVTLAGKSYNVTDIGYSRVNSQLLAFADSTVTKIIVEEGVKRLAMFVFTNAAKLTTLILPSTITDFGYNQFYNTPYLSVYMNRSDVPENVNFNGRPIYLYSESDPGATPAPNASAGFWYYGDNNEPVVW